MHCFGKTWPTQPCCFMKNAIVERGRPGYQHPLPFFKSILMFLSFARFLHWLIAYRESGTGLSGTAGCFTCTKKDYTGNQSAVGRGKTAAFFLQLQYHILIAVPGRLRCSSILYFNIFIYVCKPQRAHNIEEPLSSIPLNHLRHNNMKKPGKKGD